MKRYRLVYHRMNFRRHASSLNAVLGLVLAYYLALAAYSFFSPELPAWLFTRKAVLDAVLLIGQGVFWLWLSVAAAGFYRRNMKR